MPTPIPSTLPPTIVAMLMGTPRRSPDRRGATARQVRFLRKWVELATAVGAFNE